MDVLTHPRILVVEDETLIAIFIEDALESLGCVVVGPVSKLDSAVEIARAGELDAAVLDITIRGGLVFPVAEVLTARGIPFIFASGYGDWALPEQFRGRPRLQKPFTSEELKTALQDLPQAA